MSQLKFDCEVFIVTKLYECIFSIICVFTFSKKWEHRLTSIWSVISMVFFLLRLDNCLDSAFLYSIQRPNEYISVFQVREQLVLAVADDDAENDVNGMFSN